MADEEDPNKGATDEVKGENPETGNTGNTDENVPGEEENDGENEDIDNEKKADGKEKKAGGKEKKAGGKEKKADGKDKKADDKEKKADDKEKKDNDDEKKEYHPPPEYHPYGAGDVVTDFIEDVWKVMTPEMTERLRCVLTEDYGLSKKDADNFLRSQRDVRKQRICLPKDKRDVRIGIRNQWIKELSKDIADPIASFLVSILLSNRTPRTKKLTEKILQRLCEITGEKCTVKSAKTKIQRMLVVIADRMATYFDEALTEYEREMGEMYGPVLPVEDWDRESIVTHCLGGVSSETYTPSEYEKDEYDLDQLSDTELERLLAEHARKPSKKVSIDDEEKPRKKVSIEDEEEIISDEGEIPSEKAKKKKILKKTPSGAEEEEEDEGSEAIEETEEGEADEDEVSAEVEEEEEGDEEEDEEEKDEEEEEEEPEEDEEAEEEEKVEEEEDEAENEEEEEEEVEAEEEEEEEEEESGEEEEGEEGEEEEEEGTEKRLRKHLDILELMKEDIETTPKEDQKTDRQRAIKEILEKRFEDLAKDKLNKSVDTIVRFDVDETASIVANWLEKILPSGDIAAALAGKTSIPSLIQKQGSAFEVTDEGSQLQVRKLSSTTVAKEVAETKGIDFSARKKKLPRSMSPINPKTAKDWVDWAEEAVNVGEEWGKWLDKALDDVEKHMVKGKVAEKDKDTEKGKDAEKDKVAEKDNDAEKDKDAEKGKDAEKDKVAEKDKEKPDQDTESPQEEKPEDYKGWKEALEHEAQKWRLEKRKLKGEAYLWNKKLESGNKPVSPGPEKETKVVDY